MVKKKKKCRSLFFFLLKQQKERGRNQENKNDKRIVEIKKKSPPKEKTKSTAVTNNDVTWLHIKKKKKSSPADSHAVHSNLQSERRRGNTKQRRLKKTLGAKLVFLFILLYFLLVKQSLRHSRKRGIDVFQILHLQSQACRLTRLVVELYL